MQIPKMLVATCLAAIVLAGCQKTRWLALEGADRTHADLQRARIACDLDAQSDRLEQAGEQSASSMRQAHGNEAKMLLRDNIQMTGRAINAEIEACMRQQGFEAGS